MADSFKARPKFTGRKQELEQLYNDLNSDSSIRLILGEAGIGKSTLLDKFSEELKRYRSEKCFVGYYKRGSLIIGASPIYPFITALEESAQIGKR